LSLLGYISAFDLTTWVLFLFSFISSVVVWNRIFVKGKGGSFAAMFIPKILLGQSTNEIGHVRLLTGVWVLMGLILSNNYQGNNIDQLTSPHELKKYETFDEIFDNNFTFHSLPTKYKFLLAISKLAEFHDSWPGSWYASEVKFAKMYFHKKIKPSGESHQDAMEPIIKLPSNILELKAMVEFSYYVEIISKCGKDVFADTLPYVDKLRSKLRLDKSQISQSKIAFGQIYQLWQLEHLQITAEEYARRRFGIVESGLVHIWNEWKDHLESWNDTVQEAKQVSILVKPLSLKGNLVVVFYVDLVLKSLCIFTFVCECKKYFENFLTRTILSVIMAFKFVYCICCVGIRKRLRSF